MEDTLKGITYFFSFLNFLAKMVLSVSLWIQYYKTAMIRQNSINKQATSLSNPLSASAMIPIGLTYESR